MSDLPASWDDEPWPLEEPDISYGKVTNWSDTHEDPPQVADLADEAWQYAMDHACSMSEALVTLQRREEGRSRLDRFYSQPRGQYQHSSIWNQQPPWGHRSYTLRLEGGPGHGQTMELPTALPIVRYPVPEPVNYRSGGIGSDLATCARQPLFATYSRERPLDPRGADWLYVYQGMG